MAPVAPRTVMVAYQDDPGGTSQAQAVLRGDLEVVRRYGEANLNVWAGVRFQNKPSVRLVAGFSANLGTHRQALAGLVEHPGQLIVEKVPLSLAQLKVVEDQVRAAACEGVLLSTGPRSGRLHVRLHADQEGLAAQLLARYGDGLELEVGAFRYPMPADVSVPPVRRSRYEPVNIEGLELSLHLDAKAVPAGHRGRAAVVVHYTGTGRAGPLYSGQPLIGALFDELGREVGGLGKVPIAGTGLVLDLGPDERLRLPVLYGTASLRSDWGYLVPPGRYWLRAEVPIKRDLPGVPRQALAVPAEELTVLPPGPQQEPTRRLTKPNKARHNGG